MKSVNYGHRQRMRQRLVSEGVDNFADHEVLEVLLYLCIPYKDTNKIAHQLLETFGSVHAVLDAPTAELASIKGIGKVVATNIRIIRDCYYWYGKSKADETKIEAPGDFAVYAQQVLKDSNVERMVVIFVDGMTRCIGKRIFNSQDTGNVFVNNKDIVSSALSYNARGVLVFHNHIDTTSLPSNSDIKYTEGLYNTLKGIDVTLLEHAIFGNDGCYSMRTNGELLKIMEKYNN